MRYETDLMRAILTNAKAREIIDYVSPIYGNSYVGLWIYQAIGAVMGMVYGIAEQLRNETNPVTTELLISYWEAQYGIPSDDSLTTEQRRARIVSRTSTRGPCNPTILAASVSAALNGASVEITENVAQNKFLVNVRDVVSDITPAVAVIEEMKPAHLIYSIQIATQTVAEADIKAAIALVRSEQFKLEVQQ